PSLGVAGSAIAFGVIPGGSDGARYPTETLLSTPCFSWVSGGARALCTAPRPRDLRNDDDDLTKPLPVTCGYAPTGVPHRAHRCRACGRRTPRGGIRRAVGRISRR